MIRRTLLWLGLLVSLASSKAAQTGSWLQVTTPHFTVISDSAESDARRVTRQFERMRSAFQRIFPDANLDTATPIVVLAVEDKANLEGLLPQAYLGKGKLALAGLFVRAPEKTYILVNPNSPGVHPYAAVYHEYTHFILSRTGEWMPLWLSEGLAEYYQNTEIYDDEVRVGKVDSLTLEFLQHNPLLPLATLLAIDVHSPYYHEEDKGSTFYAESWALALYLKTKDDRDKTQHVQDYLDLMHKGVETVAAATQAFGDLDQLQAGLQKYVMTSEDGYARLPSSVQLDDAAFSVRNTTKIQIDAIRGEFLAHIGRDGDARTLLDAVLHDDPGNVSAHVAMGYLSYRSEKYDEAHQWCEQAVQLNQDDFTAHYCSAASWLKKGNPDAATQARIVSSLQTAIRLNPSFGLAYDALGTALCLRGKNYVEAQQWMEKGLQLEPGNVEMRIDQANLQMRMNNNKDAIHTLELALKLAHTPEEVAALENVLQYARRYQVERAKLQNKVSLQLTPVGGQSAKTVGMTPPRAIYSPQPEYTEEARAAKREGNCVLSLLVGLDGKPSNIVVSKKLGMGLDQKAVEAVRKWKFEPARQNGRPILGRLTLTISFKLFGGLSEKFIELSEKAKAGDPAAEFELANAFFEGRDIPKDEGQGWALLERAAQDGLPRAQFQMAERTYGNGDISENYVAAYVWYALAQRAGLTQSDARINELEGKMTPEQLSEARKRLEGSASPAAK